MSEERKKSWEAYEWKWKAYEWRWLGKAWKFSPRKFVGGENKQQSKHKRAS